MTPLFICAIEQNTMILCERHAQAFETAAMVANTPHTVYEMDDSDTQYYCAACDLQEVKDEMTRPKIIMPGDLQ